MSEQRFVKMVFAVPAKSDEAAADEFSRLLVAFASSHAAARATPVRGCVAAGPAGPWRELEWSFQASGEAADEVSQPPT